MKQEVVVLVEVVVADHVVPDLLVKVRVVLVVVELVRDDELIDVVVVPVADDPEKVVCVLVVVVVVVIVVAVVEPVVAEDVLVSVVQKLHVASHIPAKPPHVGQNSFWHASFEHQGVLSLQSVRLQRFSGQMSKDMHRENVDDIEVVE